MPPVSELLGRLVAINSINPDLVPGSPGEGAGAHAVEEWVDLDSVERCARIYLETARAFCA
ncbi:hypothetical protein [Calidithermus roseus]|uniref:Peptidase M20 n=1 Tax=Calidithermus roseus TaxID=1644118 RepID=A0A399EY63_9DEIN|nr:hypothetical protein [Calidithermus roseus]RIH87231.1 hypothetical protein Mrose_01370 [Calidithermus roseus]